MDGKSQVQSQGWLNPETLMAFIDELREAGYNIGIAQYIAAQDLILALLAQGIKLDRPQRLKRLLGPLLCKSPGEQDDFQQRFDQWINRMGWAVTSTTNQANVKAVALEQELIEIRKQSRRWKYWWLFVLGIVSFIILGVGIVYLRSLPTSTGVNPAPPPPPPTTLEWKTVLGALLIPLGTFLFWQIWWRWRARLFLKRSATTQEPELTKVSIPGAEKDLFPSLMFLQIAQRLRGRIQVPSTEIDIDRTIEKTVNQGAWFTPVYGSRRVLPEYIFLIDRASYRDHQARFITEMIDRLIHNGVFITAYYFDDDPRICFPMAGKEPPQKLYELAAKYSQHRLMVFSEAERMFSPFTGEVEPWVELFSAWNDRAVLTPKPTENWGFEELELSQQFMILPATPKGMLNFVRNLQHGESSFAASERDRTPLPDSLRARPLLWLERDPPEPQLVENVLTSLQLYLGKDGYHWLSACAVFPELDWNLTTYLGNTLKTEDGLTLLQACQLTDMARLPWFRYGYMPDWLRLRLVAELSQQQEQEIRLTLDLLMVTAVQGTVSGIQLEVANKHSNSLSKLARKLLPLMAKKASQDSPLRDYVFLSFMAGEKQKLAVELPKSLYNLLAAKQQLKVGRRFWFQWLLATTLCSAASWGIVFSVFEVLLSITSVSALIPVFIGVINGLLTGGVQIYVVRQYGLLRFDRWMQVGWILSTMLIVVQQFWIIFSFNPVNPFNLYGSLAIGVTILGSIQAYILYKILRRSKVWYLILSRLLGDSIGVLTLPLANAVYSYFGSNKIANIPAAITMGAGLGVASGAITGAALVWILRQPVSVKKKQKR